MNEDDARRLLLVRAVESEDSAEVLLTREDRDQATGSARAAEDDHGARTSATARDAAFLAARARFAEARLKTRFPAIATASRSAHWPQWLNWTIPLAALVIGVMTNEIDSAHRLNIISFPLLGMIAWNFAVYAVLLAGLARRAGRNAAPRGHRGAAGLIERLARPFRQRLEVQPVLSRALARFATDWTRASSKLTARRTARTLHLASAALASGVVLGMYLRALGVEYRASWGSTFIDAAGLHALLNLALGPASALSGIAIPDAAHLQSLEWSRGKGENAAPWIHLYATTALIFIVVPRLVLAMVSAAAAHRLASLFPVPGREDFYVRRLLRTARGGKSVVRVIPYSFQMPADLEARLRSALISALGDGTEIVGGTPVPYGGEDEWLAGAALGDEEDHLLVLFNLSATPEAENHGAFVAGLSRRLTERRSGASLAVVLEESAYRRRLGGQAGAESRIETRRLAWRRMLEQQGVRPVAVDLAEGESAKVAQALEGALMQAALVPESETVR